MPGFDRRGPEGMGPGTGRCRGYCNTENSRPDGRGHGHGRGFGPARGGGFGAGRRFGGRRDRGFYPEASVGYFGAERCEDVYPKEDEKKMLKDEAAFIAKRLTEVEARLAELEEGEKSSGDVLKDE